MTRRGNPRIVFTPARIEALRAHWEAGRGAEEIAQRLNTLPGEYPVSGAMAVLHKASALGLKRPKGWRAARRKAVAQVTWTAERLELLRNLINLIPDADVLDKVNALPGPKAKSIGAMRDRAQRMGYLAARPRPPGQMQPTWTDERLSFLRANYGRIRPWELVERLQAMAGQPIANIKTVRSAAVRFGIRSPCILRTPPKPRARRTRKPTTRQQFAATPSAAPDEPRPLTAEEQEAHVAIMLARREEQAMALFAAGKDATSVSAALKIPLREAMRLQGLYREHKREAA